MGRQGEAFGVWQLTGSLNYFRRLPEGSSQTMGTQPALCGCVEALGGNHWFLHRTKGDAVSIDAILHLQTEKL